ncbi:hypothetical protein LNAOJCKE_2137 [Methylorubrum aminovorans]|jgi:hypothetical protein|uniref:DUF2946 domain-containing protein n=6 Tax=Methylobacteriaceae TaxID=119045 RepID=A0AA37HPF6_9HYPH|nr:hypothetical protein Mpop_4081 [Methylorubrum populi BJ001]EHP94584.1 hypothetical protein MetexDRAFT_0544 [Methylorubrum extorquens DSM 13060]KNY24048.1 hypothetical protein AKJ13_01915 [Methylobacterium sp. ARG-1]MBB5764069.1 hypothetical protein [Methylorubrum rhodesianum]MBI1687157.1 hypothetical protein [Methylorubrum sp. DB1722]MDQ0522265.1 hypothetical protein [Methylobacterium gregans]OAH20256.1 hypothetical protein AX289_30280 [Methylorubrum populi]QIJ76380.1 hypothetical protein
MTSARRHMSFGAMTGWWATAALALVLALAIAMPGAGLMDDLVSHQGRQGHDRSELSLVPHTVSGLDHASDPGSADHVHCGCHVALSTTVAGDAPLPDGTRPSYARLSERMPSVSPDRLPRPPRA